LKAENRNEKTEKPDFSFPNFNFLLCLIGRRRLNSEDQNQKRPKINQRQRIKRQENTNGRSRYETSHTENGTATINPTPKNSFRRFPPEGHIHETSYFLGLRAGYDLRPLGNNTFAWRG
jgi:hypothetical protein